MPVNGPEPTSGRETRLLVLVVVVSLAVLLLLARYRFPAANIATVNPSPGPLAGMAARATFEEMAATLANVLSRADGALEVIRLEPVPAPEAQGGGDAARGREAPSSPSAAAAVAAEPGEVRPAAPGSAPTAQRRFTVALRVRPDVGLLYLPAGWQPAGIRDFPQPVEVAWTDAERGIAAVRLAPVTAALPGLPQAAPGVTGFLYVGVIQGTRSGPMIQPAFISRAETETDARWSAPLVVVSAGAGLPVGALVYTIDGRLVGLSTGHEAGVAIIPAAALDDAVTRLTSAGAPQE